MQRVLQPCKENNNSGRQKTVYPQNTGKTLQTGKRRPASPKARNDVFRCLVASRSGAACRRGTRRSKLWNTSFRTLGDAVLLASVCSVLPVLCGLTVHGSSDSAQLGLKMFVKASATKNVRGLFQACITSSSETAAPN